MNRALFRPAVSVLCLLLLAESAGANAAATKPLWFIDLQPFGYSYDNTEKSALMNSPDVGVLFLNPQIVIAYFVSAAPKPALSSRDPHEMSASFQLNAVSFNVDTGKLISVRRWPTRRSPSQIWATSQGNLLVRTGDLLEVYSKSGESLHQLDLSAIQPGGYWDLFLSPDREILWLWDVGSMTLKRVASDTLEVIESGTSEGIRSEPSFSDDEIMRVGLDKRRVGNITLLRKLLEIRTLATAWKSIYELGASGCGGLHQFVSHAALIVGSCGSITIVSNDGTPLMHDEIDKHQQVENKVSISQDQRSAAVSMSKSKPDFMDTGKIRRSSTILLVYDLHQFRRVAALDIKPVPRSNYDFSVAPSGDKVAVLSNSNLAIYGVGEQPRTGQEAGSAPR